MQMKKTIIFLILLLFTTLIFTGCEEDIDNKDPENINVDPQQQREILQERHDVAERGNPILQADLEETNPAREETEATGNLTIVLQGNSIHIKGAFSGLSSPYTDSFIHEVLQSDIVQRLNPSLNENKTAGSWEESYVLDEGTIEKLKADSLYISVYSEKYEDEGELRAQITNWDSVAVASPQEQQQEQK